MIKEFSLSHFRNHRQAQFATESRVVLFTGSNGAGKTNCLEALSFLVSGRGLRNAKLEDILPFAVHPNDALANPELTSPRLIRDWGIQAVVANNAQLTRLATGFSCQQNSENSFHQKRRHIMINGNEKSSQQALDEHLRMLWYVPQMARLFQDGRMARLKFIDRTAILFDKSHYGRLKAYEQQMRERLILLLQGGNKTWLDIIEQEMAMRAVSIAVMRKQIVFRLNQITHIPKIVNFPSIIMELTGGNDPKILDGGAVQGEQDYQQKLFDNRKRDQTYNRTHYGVHLTDIVIRYYQCPSHSDLGNKDFGSEAKSFSVLAQSCSTGEQKIILLSLILAQLQLMLGEMGPRPILLLDDIGAHLDSQHLQFLYDYLLHLDVQLFFTGTDAVFLQYLDDKYLHYKLD